MFELSVIYSVVSQSCLKTSYSKTIFPMSSSDTIFAQNAFESIKNTYLLEYLLEEIRVTFKSDVKISINDINVDAKEGDIVLLPRWLTKILSGKNLIEVQDNEISSYVSKALNRERISKPHDISGVDVDFYIRVNDFLATLNEKEGENLMVSLNSFVMSRLEKIVKLAAASSLSVEMEAKLSAEEKQLYNFVHSSSLAFKEWVLKK
jgi:DNA replication factor GINS